MAEARRSPANPAGPAPRPALSHRSSSPTDTRSRSRESAPCALALALHAYEGTESTGPAALTCRESDHQPEHSSRPPDPSTVRVSAQSTSHAAGWGAWLLLVDAPSALPGSCSLWRNFCSARSPSHAAREARATVSVTNPRGATQTLAHCQMLPANLDSGVCRRQKPAELSRARCGEGRAPCLQVGATCESPADGKQSPHRSGECGAEVVGW
jgi:hypothetical protein